MILDIFFKFFHLAIFISAGIYFFKKFYFQDIKDKIQQEKDAIKDLEMDQKEIFEKVNTAKDDTSFQLKNCKIFNHKVILWKNSFEQKKHDKIDQVEKTRSILNNKINYQVERYQQKKVEAQILPDILNELEDELYEYYSSGIHANDYMFKIAESLKKSSK